MTLYPLIRIINRPIVMSEWRSY